MYQVYYFSLLLFTFFFVVLLFCRHGVREVDPVDILGAVQGGAGRAERGARQLVPGVGNCARQRGGKFCFPGLIVGVPGGGNRGGSLPRR